jgi:hypothetical protein
MTSLEMIAPAVVGLGYLYIISNQNKKKEESYQNVLPNTNIPDKNYPNNYSITNPELDLTSSLTNNNRIRNPGGVYTDKYFQPNQTGDSLPPDGNSYKSLSGQFVSMDYFRHNNMQPYFGSKSHTGGNASYDQILDNYQGAGSHYIAKTETSPLFEPNVNYQHPFGTPNQTDFIKSRINPSMKMSNVKPFEDVKVGPGLGMGQDGQSQMGYNNGLWSRDLWREKSVDEMRVKTNQKPTEMINYGLEGPACSMIKKRGEHGIQEKNKVDTTAEISQNYSFTNVGVDMAPSLRYTAPTLRTIENDKETARETTAQEYKGAASFGGGGNSQYVTGKYLEPHKQALESYPMTPVSAVNKVFTNQNDYNVKSYQTYTNNRILNQDYGTTDNYVGIVGSFIGASVAPILDALKPSRKEEIIQTMRPYQNPKTAVSQSYVFNPKDRAPATIRESTGTSINHLHVNRQQHGGAYESTPHQPDRNERDTTTDFYYAGGGSANERGRLPRSYEAEYRQRNNDIKSSTIDGRLNTGNMNLYNGDVNIHSKSTTEQLLTNNRTAMANYPYNPPSTQNFGNLQGSANLDLYSGQQLDRNNGDVLEQLKKNPFTLPSYYKSQ